MPTSPPKYATTSRTMRSTSSGRRAAVRVAQHEARGARLRRTLEHPHGELGVAAVAVEEVLGVVEHLATVGVEERHRVGDHRHALVEGGAERLEHVVVPRLAHDAHGRRARGEEVAERVVGVDLALDAPGRPERDQRRGVEVQLGRRAPEELVVLRVGAGPARLDEVDAEPVELLGDAQLVVDGERDALELAAVAQRRVVDLDALRPTRAVAYSWRVVSGHTPTSPCSAPPRRARRRSTSPGACG